MSALPEDYGQGGSPPRQPRFPSSTAGPDHSSDQRGPPSDHSTASGTTETGHNGDQNGSSPSHPSEAGGPDSTHDGITHAPESNTEHNNYPVQLNGHPNGDINGILTENAEPNSEESTLPIQPIAQSNGVIHDAGGEGTEADIKDLTSAPPETPHQNSPISVVHGNSPNGVAGPPGPSPYNSPATSSPRDREDQEDSPVDDQDDDQEDEQDDDQVHNRVNGHQNHRGNGRGNGRGSGHGHGRGGSHGNGQGNGRGCSYGNGQGNGQGNGTPGSSIGSNGPTNVVAQGSVVDKSGTHDSSVPSTNVDLGSRANSGEQSIDSENFVSGDERHDGRGQNTTVSERNQALIDSDQSNLHTSHDREAHGGVLIFDGPGVSSSRNRGNASHSQYHSPGRHPTRFTLPSRAGPSSQDPAVFHPPPPVSQSLRPSSMNPIAPNFMPRPQQTGNISPGFTVPRWQPDSEAINCSICDARFGMFIRKHHCRKCGRVVCHSCSPHRITIPYAFIVRPPGVEGGGNATPLGPMGGERVRLCNPCVPDPNTTPPPRHPQNPQHSQPLVVDGRSSVARPLNDSGPSAESYRRHLSASSQVSNVYRSRSASTVSLILRAWPSEPLLLTIL
ncbi:hypothetical protein GGR50DRAFT_127188 [Xylaria sp. CBS 124048]|nr:hypothetical protein GGR50DRAFT_127188 [Xylaria sp. CBS 124048]